MPIEEVRRLFEHFRHDGPTVMVPVLLEIDLGVLAQFHGKLVGALVVFREERFEVGGEAFVQPGVGPVPAGQ